ncbi:SixA phosphatase family protein [Marinospirillum perlucidum]|uniref:SixA phosphatase family protein n=1 Tax=Marinospirillum perlucidum TaxID=1982602 RepID=UPI00139052BB|nr:histidine phosphatase family protein [Marinospirillum perlucidum]
MKQLTLIRHAKSSWQDPDQSDWDRPLNKRGQRDLPGLTQRLLQKVERPDLLLFSGAQRTLETQAPLAAAWQLPATAVKKTPQAYEASLNTLLMLLQEQPDSCERLVLVGHNPGMSELLAFLIGETPRHYPTAAFAHLLLPISSWTQLEPGTAKLEVFDYPKLHG